MQQIASRPLCFEPQYFMMNPSFPTERRVRRCPSNLCNGVSTSLKDRSAVRAALDQVGRMVLEHSIEHCIRDAAETGGTEDSIKSLKKSLDQFIG